MTLAEPLGVEVNDDATASGAGETYFLRSVFADGTILGFYSHTPAGNCYDQQQGWVIIDPKNKLIIEMQATKTWGEATGEYREWMSVMRQWHGKTVKTFRGDDGRYIWLMNE